MVKCLHWLSIESNGSQRVSAAAKLGVSEKVSPGVRIGKPGELNVYIGCPLSRMVLSGVSSSKGRGVGKGKPGELSTTIHTRIVPQA